MIVVTKDHLTEEQIEKYAMGNLRGDECDQVEEHLLICATCQDVLGETDSFLTHIRVAGQRLADKPQTNSAWTKITYLPALAARPLPAMAAGLCTLAIVLFIVAPQTNMPDLEPQRITLESLRGSNTDPVVAKADRSLLLLLDASGLPESATTFSVKIVNDGGKEELSGTGTIQSGKLSMNVSKGLSAGSYFVRVYDSSEKLLREFVLLVS